MLSAFWTGELPWLQTRYQLLVVCVAGKKPGEGVLSKNREGGGKKDNVLSTKLPAVTHLSVSELGNYPFFVPTGFRTAVCPFLVNKQDYSKIMLDLYY